MLQFIYFLVPQDVVEITNICGLWFLSVLSLKWHYFSIPPILHLELFFFFVLFCLFVCLPLFHSNVVIGSLSGSYNHTQFPCTYSWAGEQAGAEILPLQLAKSCALILALKSRVIFIEFFFFSNLLSGYYTIYLEGCVHFKWLPFSKSHKDTTGASGIPSPPPIQGRVGW